MLDGLTSDFNRILAERSAPSSFQPTSAGSDQRAVNFLKHCANNARVSSAQLFQDLFAVFVTGGKRNGFFVEFGATDGLHLSNTYLLERKLDWTGILAEPAKIWHEKLSLNRRAAVDFRCVWGESGKNLSFIETSRSDLSALAEFADKDHKAGERENIAATYSVETISLNDLLLAHNAPQKIDYLSMDTEGAEFDILKTFNFQKYKIGIITVEANNPSVRPAMRKLIESAGFFRVFEQFSKWDDWYLNRSIYPI